MFSIKRGWDKLLCLRKRQTLEQQDGSDLGKTTRVPFLASLKLTLIAKAIRVSNSFAPKTLRERLSFATAEKFVPASKTIKSKKEEILKWVLLT